MKRFGHEAEISWQRYPDQIDPLDSSLYEQDLTAWIAGVSDPAYTVYSGFSPKKECSEEYARILKERISLLRQSVQVEKQIASYGLKDWK